jgi:hypothetical protein
MVTIILPCLLVILLATVITALFFKGAGGDQPLGKPRDLQARRRRR